MSDPETVINGYTFRLTSSSHPEQYDVFRDGEQVGYVRLRGGELTLNCPNVAGVEMYRKSSLGDQFDDELERTSYLYLLTVEVKKFEAVRDFVGVDKQAPPETTTLRDEFAMRAMQSFTLLDTSYDVADEDLAIQSYNLADAMLAERNSRQNPTEGSPAASGV